MGNLLDAIDAYGSTHTLDMSNLHGFTLRVQRGETGRQFHEAMWAAKELVGVE